MEAPKKIYVPVKRNKVTNTWNSTWIGVHDVEYIRKDVFIEKVWDWIEDNILSSSQQDKSLLYYKRFKKYLDE